MNLPLSPGPTTIFLSARPFNSATQVLQGVVSRVIESLIRFLFSGDSCGTGVDVVWPATSEHNSIRQT